MYAVICEDVRVILNMVSNVKVLRPARVFVCSGGNALRKFDGIKGPGALNNRCLKAAGFLGG
jgi:hypothetical protein